MKNVDFVRLAQELYFNAKTFEKYIEDNKIQYRKGKDLKDVVNSIKKACKNGRYKVENELGFLEIYLKDVFKKKSNKDERNINQNF